MLQWWSMSRVGELVSNIYICTFIHICTFIYIYTYILFPRQIFPASRFFVMKQSPHSTDLENFGNQILS